MIHFAGIDCDATVYESNLIGAPIPGGDQTVTIEAQTQVILMDIPLLRDQDDDPGIYAAVYTLGSGTWSGAVIQRADTAAGPFTEIASTTRLATVGRASTALTAHTRGNVMDFSNTVDVQMFNGTVASITRSAVINNGNYALLGDELIQFQTAVLLSGTTYRLSNLMRERKGTYSTGHLAGDRFVLLQAATLMRLAVPLDLVGGTRYYRATSFGATPAAGHDQSLLHTGAAIKPLRAGNIVAVREIASNDVVIGWHRRARLSAAWRDLVDVPLDETTEAYEVDIYDSTNTTLLRELTSTTPEVTYTDAQQITRRLADIVLDSHLSAERSCRARVRRADSVRGGRGRGRAAVGRRQQGQRRQPDQLGFSGRLYRVHGLGDVDRLEGSRLGQVVFRNPDRHDDE